MPEIEIRPAIDSDIPALIAIDHNYSSEFVWQMEIQAEEKHIGISFREIRLPRSVRVEYPRRVGMLANDWMHRSGLLVATLEGEGGGYISLMLEVAPITAWATDLASGRRMRRQGIGSALVLAAQEWAEHHTMRRIVLVIQPENHPALKMAQRVVDIEDLNEKDRNRKEGS